jgi:Predicted phosphohydrolases
VTETVLAHVSDLHFGAHADLNQLERLPAYLTELAPSAIVVSGDLTQRARHGEFMAAHLFLQELQPIAPLLVMPGNHDVQWWASPFGIFGQRAKYAKYRRYFGEDLTPALKIPGAVIAALLSSHGIAFGSLTWNPNDMTTIGHLPESEVNRVRNSTPRRRPMRFESPWCTTTSWVGRSLAGWGSRAGVPPRSA